MKIEYFVMIFIFAMIMMIHAKPVHADSVNPIKILDVHVEPDTLKVNDTFLISSTILNSLPYPIYLTSGSCTPAFSVIFDSHAKQVYPKITCTTEARIHKVNPMEETTISNANKPGTIYQAIMAGTANAKIILPYFAKNQTSTNYSNVDYTVSKSFQFLIHEMDNTKQETPVENVTIPIHVPGHLVIDNTMDSPLKQFKSGIKAENVECNSGFLLAISRNYLPACVTESTAENLLLRGWILGFAHYIPMYFVKPNSTSEMSVEYFPLHLKNQTLPDVVFQLNSRFYKSDTAFPTSEINATVQPNLIHTQLDTIVQYVITTSNTRGVYWLSLEYPCDLVPVAVGISPSHLTTSDLQNPSNSMLCPAPETQFHVARVSGVTLKLVHVD